MWATGPVSASLTCISERSALGWVWFDLAEPLPRPSLPSSCHRRARQGCGQGGGGSGRAAPALLTPGHSRALSWPSPGMGLGWIPRPSLGKHGGCPPAHTSPLLSPSVAPEEQAGPGRVSHLRLGCPSCGGTGALPEAGRGFWPHVLSPAGLGVFHRHCTGKCPLLHKQGPYHLQGGAPLPSLSREPRAPCAPAALTTDR